MRRVALVLSLLNDLERCLYWRVEIRSAGTRPSASCLFCPTMSVPSVRVCLVVRVASSPSSPLVRPSPDLRNGQNGSILLFFSCSRRSYAKTMESVSQIETKQGHNPTLDETNGDKYEVNETMGHMHIEREARTFPSRHQLSEPGG